MFTATSRSTLLRLAAALALIGCCTLAMTRAQDPAPTQTPPVTPAPTTTTPAPVVTSPSYDIPLPAKYMHDDIQYLTTTPASAAPTPAKSIRRARPAPPSGTAKPFTGYLKIRQQNGTLTYEINVLRGKVVSGIETYLGSDAVTSDIVGGWFDRDRLVLMIQARDPDITKDGAANLHQFRRTEDGFTIDHSLLGYGKSDENHPVYRPHTIDRMIEVD